MVLKREGKTLELKLRVSCGSWPEDGTQFILCCRKVMVFVIHIMMQLFLKISEFCR
jgi:hypothetical protein